MNLKKIYKEIIDVYKTGNYQIQNFSSKDFCFDEKELPLYAMNFLICEFMKSKNDFRWKSIIDVVVKPLYIDKVNFEEIQFEDFFNFMIETKNFN